MDIRSRETRLGQAGLLAVAFATPFSIAFGSGGYVHPLPTQATGSANFVTIVETEYNRAGGNSIFFQQVASLGDKYGLGKDQLAQILNVSRPTIYSWLDGEASRLKTVNRERITLITELLETHIAKDLQQYLGKLLRRKLDAYTQQLTERLFANEVDREKLSDTLASADFKLDGIRRSEMLRNQLHDKHALI